MDFDFTDWKDTTKLKNWWKMVKTLFEQISSESNNLFFTQLSDSADIDSLDDGYYEYKLALAANAGLPETTQGLLIQKRAWDNNGIIQFSISLHNTVHMRRSYLSDSESIWTDWVYVNQSALDELQTEIEALQDGTGLADGAVTELAIKDGAVTNAKLAAGAVSTDKLASGAVTTAKIYTGAVTEDKLADNAVTTDKIADGAVTTEKLTATIKTDTDLDILTATGTYVIQSGCTNLPVSGWGVLQVFNDGSSVMQVHYPDTESAVYYRRKTGGGGTWGDWEYVNQAELDELQTEIEALQDGTGLADGAVTEAKIADHAVTFDKIAEDSIGTSKIQNGAVTASCLAENAVITDRIRDGAVTSAKLAASTITLANIDNMLFTQLADDADIDSLDDGYYEYKLALAANAELPETTQGLLIQKRAWDENGIIQFSISLHNTVHTRRSYLSDSESIWTDWVYVNQSALDELQTELDKKLSLSIVDALPSSSVTYDFEDGVSLFTTPMIGTTSKGTSSVATDETTGNRYQSIKVTDGATIGSSSNVLSKLDFSSTSENATDLTVEFDFQYVDNGRMRIALCDLDVQDAKTGNIRYDFDGFAADIWSSSSNQFLINSSGSKHTTFFGAWLHARFDIDFSTNTFTYKIVNNDDSSDYLSGTADFHGDCTKVTGIIVYTWNAGDELYIDNIEITARTEPTDNIIYGIETDEGLDAYTYVNGKAREIGAIADGAVTEEKLADGAVTHDKLATDAVDSGNIVDECIGSVALKDGAVEERNIADGAVTVDKLADGLKTYSAAPQKVGYWTDGTPVWRAAFDESITENTSGELALGLISDENDYRYINGMICLSIDYDAVDTSAYCNSGNGIFAYSSDGGLVVSYINNAPCNRIYGWIEFAAPESNISA